MLYVYCQTSEGVLKDSPQVVEVNCILLSKEQYMVHLTYGPGFTFRLA